MGKDMSQKPEVRSCKAAKMPSAGRRSAATGTVAVPGGGKRRYGSVVIYRIKTRFCRIIYRILPDKCGGQPALTAYYRLLPDKFFRGQAGGSFTAETPRRRAKRRETRERDANCTNEREWEREQRGRQESGVRMEDKQA